MTNPIINQDPNSHHPSKMSLAKKIVVIGALAIGLILMIVLWALGSKSADTSNVSPNEIVQKAASTKHTADGQVPQSIQTKMDKKTEITPKSEIVKTQQLTPITAPQIIPPKLTLDMQRSMAYEQQMRDYRQQQKLSAMASDTMVQFKSQTASSQSSLENDPFTRINAQTQLLQDRLAQTVNPTTSTTGAYNAPLSEHQQKRAFTEENRNTGYLTHSIETPISPYVLNVGTIIPATLIGGINSDLAGQVIASVSQNVYDSASGAYLLIPQGSKLYGVYDSQVSYGQSRVLLAWNRINFPDGTTLNIDNMGGMDTEGYSGFEDEVDNHYFRIFGNALLLGVISGATQAGVSNGEDKNKASAVADGVTQQFAQTGSNLIQKNLNIQATIKIRNGYKFNVMVNKDVVLTPYIAHR